MPRPVVALLPTVGRGVGGSVMIWVIEGSFRRAGRVPPQRPTGGARAHGIAPARPYDMAGSTVPRVVRAAR